MSEVSNDFFEYGASFIVPKRDYDMYYKNPSNMLGNGGERFVTPTNQMDKLLILADGNTTVIEVGLGKEIGDWSGQELVRIDVDKSIVTELYNDGRLTLPTGNEPGANGHFEYGGKTSGHMSEGILRDCPVSNIDRVGNTTLVNGIPVDQPNSIYHNLGGNTDVFKTVVDPNGIDDTIKKALEK